MDSLVIFGHPSEVPRRMSRPKISYPMPYADAFAKPYPDRTTIVNGLGPQLRYEIEVVAVRPA